MNTSSDSLRTRWFFSLIVSSQLDNSSSSSAEGADKSESESLLPGDLVSATRTENIIIIILIIIYQLISYNTVTSHS